MKISQSSCILFLTQEIFLLLVLILEDSPTKRLRCGRSSCFQNLTRPLPKSIPRSRVGPAQGDKACHRYVCKQTNGLREKPAQLVGHSRNTLLDNPGTTQLPNRNSEDTDSVGEAGGISCLRNLCEVLGLSRSSKEKSYAIARVAKQAGGRRMIFSTMIEPYSVVHMFIGSSNQTPMLTRRFAPFSIYVCFSSPHNI